MKTIAFFVSTAVVAALAVELVSAAPLGTAFTYQGRLNNGTNPANGIHDLRFTIYDALTSGNAVGSPLTNTATGVTNGLFTVSLDFGATAFDGNARWLTIEVRTNGGGAFTPLAPRQALTPTPYAQYAPSAGTSTVANTVPSGAITSAMLADGAVTSNKISASVLKALNLDDGGSAAYAEMMSASRGMQTTDPLPFSELSLVVSNGGAAPSLTFQVHGSSFGKVLGFTGREGISEVYEYVVEVLNPTGSLNPNDPIGQPGALTFTRNGRTTVFAGIITGCSQATYQGEALYTFRIEPTLAYLGLNSDYRLYQDLTAPDIVKGLYAEITSGNAVDSLSGSYPTRTLAIQVAETDLNFFNRLLEDEGAFYFFRQEEASTSLVLGNAASSYLASPIGSVRYYGNYATNPPSVTEYVRVFQKAVRESTKSATLNGYDFTAPRKSLVSKSTASIGSGEKYEYDARVSEPAVMADLARTRMERFVMERSLVNGAGNAPDLRPGYTFILQDQSGSELGGSYVITSVRHSAFRRTTNNLTSFYYGNQFEALPTLTPYRPARKAPKPVAPACTAVVTGKSGEEIWTDQYGRVKVQFRWDRRGLSDEHSSGWIRVATQLAGKGWGTFSVPRIGQEVLVEFVNGDPDQPVITGSFYNGDNTPPYALPANATRSGIQTRSSKGGTPANYNEIRFEDKKGAEELYIKAEKDLNLDVNNDTTIEMGNDLTWRVVHDLTLKVDHNLVISSGQGVGLNTPNDPTLALKVAGIVGATAFQGGGLGLSNLSATALTGTISDARLSDNVARLDEDQTFRRSVAARVFLGSGAGLTNLPAASLTGTISDARLSGNVAKLNGNPTFSGTVTASLFRGDGSGLTNLSTNALIGPINDAQIPANIPRLNADQAFSGANSFLSRIGVGGLVGADALNVNGNARLNDFDLFLRGSSDRNHGLGWYGDLKLFAGVNPDGPVLYGCAGGGLGTICGTPTLALAWNSAGNVMIDPDSLNTGSLLPGLTFGSFSGEGIASKRTAGGNQFGLDFYTYGTNRLSLTQSGRVGIGTTNPTTSLEVVGTARATRFEGDGSALSGLSTVRSWQIVTNATVTAVANRGYVANRASVVTINLPAAGILGDVVRVTGMGVGGWQVNGTSIGAVSGQATNSIELLCVTNGNWRILSRF